MGLLSLHFCEDAVDIGDDGELLGRIPTQALSEKGLDLLKRENQLRMGTVSYQEFLAGVLSGVTLLFGPPEPVRIAIDLRPEEAFPPNDGTIVPTTFDGMLPGEAVANQNLPEDPGGVLAISPELHHETVATDTVVALSETGQSSSENSASSEPAP